MLKLCRVTKVNVFFLVMVYVLNFNLFEFAAAILEKVLFLQLEVHKGTSITIALEPLSELSCDSAQDDAPDKVHSTDN